MGKEMAHAHLLQPGLEGQIMQLPGFPFSSTQPGDAHGPWAMDPK